jgi:hypothetical protein
MRAHFSFGMVLAAAIAAAPGIASAGASGPTNGGASCNLGGRIQHIVYLQFDNWHLRRDNPNVPSDLEQVPNLLNFLKGEGTLFSNQQTPLISHTSVDIVTSLTGVYPDKFGIAIGNSFGEFSGTGVKFPSSFEYWTDISPDGLPFMLAADGKSIFSAPWAPFTRAGCDVGAFSIANMEFENVTTDINNVFTGAALTQAQAEVAANKVKAEADFEGIVIHCGNAATSLCNSASATPQPDKLPNEPGGYASFQALYGNHYVQPVISPGGPVKDINGNVITDSSGNVGFPEDFDPSAAQSLGYVAKMLEAGVQVVFFYIEDMHDNHGPAEGTFGPGEAGYEAQLQQANEAFGKFFARLAADGITKDNTLFIVSADENDHFVGGPPSPANCDGVTVPCTYAKKGEIDADLSLVFATEFGNTTPFSVHFDSAPTFYLNGDPTGQTDSATRTLEQQAADLIGFDPVAGPNGSDVRVTQALADRTEQALLHMVPADPLRVPNFILFANPDFFLEAFGDTSPLCTPAFDAASCFIEEPGFAWNHGDFQNQITQTWVGFVGPGVREQGEIGTFTDHTDIRPTILTLVRLKDDYAHDGRVLTEAIHDHALPDAVRDHEETFEALANAYKQINAPRGLLGATTLPGISTAALAGNDLVYNALEARIESLTAQRNEIAGKMIAMLEAAEFDNKPIDERAARGLIDQAQDLLGPSE